MLASLANSMKEGTVDSSRSEMKENVKHLDAKMAGTSKEKKYYDDLEATMMADCENEENERR